MQPKPLSLCPSPPRDAVQHFLLLNVFIIYELINFLLLLLLLLVLLLLVLLLQSCCPARIRRQHRLLCLLWPLASLDGATDRASQVSNYPESATIESCPHRLNLFQIVVATATAACMLPAAAAPRCKLFTQLIYAPLKTFQISSSFCS